MMSEQIKIQSEQRRLSVFTKIPWSMLLIAYMVAVHLLGAGMAGATGYVFIGLCVLVMFVEFFKSGDIGAWAFLVDLIGAVGALILATVLMCYLFFKLGQSPTFFHWLGFAVILGDAVMSPFNAFRTALRNIGLGASA